MDLARERDLIVTGSSDYHGTGKPNRLGENTTAPEQLARIIRRAEELGEGNGRPGTLPYSGFDVADLHP
jgi:hypothetical protein